MYGVYIVDDESLVIKDLMGDIPWLEYGFDVGGSNRYALIDACLTYNLVMTLRV